MNNEDVGTACGDAGNVKEMNVVLSECHDGVVAIGEGGLLHILPCDGGGVGGGHLLHVEEEELAMREGVKDVRIVVEDGVEGSRIKGASGDGLGGPGLCACIVDVDGRGVGGVAIEDVDGVEELCEVARCVCAVKRSADADERGGWREERRGANLRSA